MCKKKSLIALSLIGAFLIQGCSRGVEVSSAVANSQIQDFATKQEVMDYYSESMKYGNISTRTAVKEEDIGYNTIEPESETWKKLSANYVKIMREHQKLSDYSIPDGVHDYLKVFADQMTLKDGTLRRAKEAGGFYYLTVGYKVVPNGLGNFRGYANYLGIDGVITEDVYGNEVIDESYLGVVLNKYHEKSGTAYHAFGLDNGVYSVVTGDTAGDNSGYTAEVIPEQAPEITAEVPAEANIEAPISEEPLIDIPVEAIQEVPVTQDLGQSGISSVSDTGYGITKLLYDIYDIANVVGSSGMATPIMPKLSLVYDAVGPDGEFNGYGIYSEGSHGIKEFGYDKSKDNAELTVTYVFQQNAYNPDELNYKYLFINNYTNSNEWFAEDSIANSDVTLPEFLTTNMEIMIERMDRDVNNKSIKSLMGNTSIEDDRLALKLLEYGSSTDITTFKTSIDRVVKRNDRNYLLEVTRTVEDAPRMSGAVAQYRDTYYVMIRQDGTDFKINDILLKQRELTKVPVVNPENTTVRRLVALNLAGEVTDSLKDEITKGVIQNLADYSSNKTVREDGSIAMYECFNTDTKLLTEERKEYINSRIRSLLFAKGYKNASTLTIKPTEWIGGYDTQVEFTTKEFIEYAGTNSGCYTENYYLVSHYGTEWVIDDIVPIHEEFVDGDRYNDLKKEFTE